MIDLHMHSTKSDGSETPDELVCHGCRVGLHAMALTDHDNIGGVAEFLASCRDHDITGIAGVELSAYVDDGSGTMHLLGYGINPEHPLLTECLNRVIEGRVLRNQRILERLNELGLEIDWSEIQTYADEDIVGRPHIAQALIKRNYVSSIDEAFERYLAKGALAYVDRYRLYPEDMIHMIRDAGGVAVLAHPFTWLLDEERLEAGVRKLKDMGLAGVEAVYVAYNAEQTVTLLRLAKKFDLLATGGSDYHGLNKPGVALGAGYGSLCVPDAYLPPLLQAIGYDHPWVVYAKDYEVA